MKCPTCTADGSKFGKDRTGCQRYRCGQCRKVFTDPKPLAGTRTSMDKIVLAFKMLLEGSSMRAIERITGIDHHTVIEWMLKAGEQCKDFLAYSVYQHQVNDVEIDEQWGFVGCKEKTAFLKNYGPEVGDAYVYTAIERTTKLVIAFRVAKRDSDNAHDFAQQLRVATSGQFQVSTDGYAPYSSAIPSAFGYGVSYGQIVKNYSNPQEAERRRYSPPTIIKTEKKAICGTPDQSRICTSIVERHNLSTRMHVRRMTRLTNAHSKKWENHEAMLALWYCAYNFTRVHSTLKSTPAVAAGLATETWSIERLLTEAAKVEREFATLN
ncbi:MAG: hypothetical protein FD138_1786 [Planctomycetota bacterium]|nr:MAG: hypothetical protein FD138_1786 [Planctomycetota bacterium]